MTVTTRGVLAVIGAAVIWGVSPVYYKFLAHVPPLEVLAHRTFWCFLFFVVILALQRRLNVLRAAFSGWRQTGLIAMAALMVSANWFMFIFATGIDRNTETSLGYYIYPLVAVLIGRFAFGERLSNAQWLAALLATFAVTILTIGLGAVPWIPLFLATTFSLYGAIKKFLPLGPIVSVTCEVLLIMPLSLAALVWFQTSGQGSFGRALQDDVLLVASGPFTALPLILFSYAARRVSMATVGLLAYINPTMQVLCAVLLYAEPFTPWHQIAFALIWVALALYSLSAMRQERALRKTAITSPGVSAHVTKSASDGSANP